MKSHLLVKTTRPVEWDGQGRETVFSGNWQNFNNHNIVLAKWGGGSPQPESPGYSLLKIYELFTFYLEDFRQSSCNLFIHRIMIIWAF